MPCGDWSQNVSLSLQCWLGPGKERAAETKGKCLQTDSHPTLECGPPSEISLVSVRSNTTRVKG